MSTHTRPGRWARHLPAAFVALTLTACVSAPPPHARWERIDTPPEQVAFDHRKCELEVEQAANGEVFDSPAIVEPQALEYLREQRWRREMFYRCMVDRGYRRVEAG